MSGFANPLMLLTEEFIQRADEGCQIPSRLRQAFAELHPEMDRWNTARIDPIYDALMALPEDAGLAAREPNDLQAIRASRPDGPRTLAWSPDGDELIDRLHGAWTGRAAGCALGKPVEGMGMERRDGRLRGRASIRCYLRNRGDWPLRDYFSERDVGDGLRISAGRSCRERISCMEADDDIHYSLIGLAVLEAHGPGFTWDQVARTWAARLPYESICTAETQAILNFWNRMGRRHDAGIAATPAWTRRHRNPFREWIGAQIRSDGWAFCCAGHPELAAEFAWRDAHWTHERNGIYGEMLFAAMQAAAFVEGDPVRLVEIGLSEIPRDCRLAQAVRTLVGNWIPACTDWETCMERIEAAYPDMSVVHTINNALICIMALFYGRMHTRDAPAVAVMAGLDTDCNGASVGSIVGAAAGRAAFDGAFAAPLNDTIRPDVIGFQEITMRDLAERTAIQWRRIRGA